MTTPFRVMALDDSEVIHAKLRALLRIEGLELTCTKAWTEVMDACFSDPRPDLLILDLNLPGIEGGLVGLGLRDRSDIPILIYSSEPEERRAVTAKIIGASGAFSKSQDEEFVAAVLKHR